MATMVAIASNGKTYEVDTDKKTCRKIFTDFSELDPSSIETDEVNLSTYQKYLKDRFLGEDAPIKKGKLHFRGCRIFFDSERGFVIEDTTNHYKEVETGIEGIPTLKELGDYFDWTLIKHSPEELSKAVVLGKKIKEEYSEELEEAFEEKGMEEFRKEVLSKIKCIGEGKAERIDPLTFPDMIPYKQWRRKVNKVVREWRARKIRYNTLLSRIEQITSEETFGEDTKEVKTRDSFVGTLYPDHKSVGYLVGDKLEVDGKMVDAVQFLQNYLLHFEPKVMPQLMKFAIGEIDEKELLKNPIKWDNTISYNSKLLKRTAENAMLLSVLLDRVGYIAPQDLLYTEDLKVGDKIKLYDEGKWVIRVVSSTEQGIEIGKTGLYKTDKWIKIQEEK